MDDADAFLAKAGENLAAAESEFAAGRYNSCANRAYYACYQAAVAALLRDDVRPSGKNGQWGHDFVQAQFAGLLITRRKRYPASLRDVLRETMAIRHRADYQPDGVGRSRGMRSLQEARRFLSEIRHKEGIRDA